MTECCKVHKKKDYSPIALTAIAKALRCSISIYNLLQDNFLRQPTNPRFLHCIAVLTFHSSAFQEQVATAPPGAWYVVALKPL